jgi:hypothetical protein
MHNHDLIDLNAHGKIWNETCFHLIASREHLNVLKIFEAHYFNNDNNNSKSIGAGILQSLILNNTDLFNRTAFDLACTKNNPMILKQFINIFILANMKTLFVNKLLNACNNEASKRHNHRVINFLKNNYSDRLKQHVAPPAVSNNNKKGESANNSRSSNSTCAYEQSNEENNGGWKQYQKDKTIFDSIIDENNNDNNKLKIEYNLSKTMFLKEYYSRYVPVVVSPTTETGHKSSIVSNTKWIHKKIWGKKSFIKHYGHLKTTISQLPYGNTYGEASKQVTLKDYIRKYMGKDFISMIPSTPKDNSEGVTAPNYIFDGGYIWHSTFNHIIRTPSFLSNLMNRPELKQFALGTRGSGAQPHFHQQAWNMLIYGRKRWYFKKPPTGTFHSETSLSFFNKFLNDAGNRNKNKNDNNDNDEYYEHIQTRGEIIYIPELYSHATLNLDDSIGVAMAFA